MYKTLRTSKLTATAMLILTIAALMAPNVTAGYNPSGTYLRLSDRHVLAYDNTTGTLTDLGPTSVAYSCSSGQLSRCGDCAYAPNGETDWKNVLTQYTYGRCANVHIESTTSVWVRGDVRVKTETGEDWFINYSVDYMSVLQPGVPLKTVYPIPEQDCGDSIVSLCEGRPSNWDPTNTRDIAPGTDYYCVHVRVFNIRLANVVPNVETYDACSGLLN